MIPVLYDGTEKEFRTNGFGALVDATSCTVTEEKNGMFELEMTYPSNGLHFSDIKINRIIYAKPSDNQDPQPFDIYKISKPINGHVKVFAQHISYRGRYIPIDPFEIEADSESASTAVMRDVISTIKTKAIVDDNPFELLLMGEWGTSDKSYAFNSPRSLRECLCGSDTSFINIYGGELQYDKFDIYIYKNRGVTKDSSSKVTISYSKNLIDLTSEDDATSQATGIYPYYSGANGVVAVSGEIKEITESDTPYRKIISVDFRDQFEDTPTVEQLNVAADKYITDNKLGTIPSKLEVSFVALWQTENYKNVAPLERVSLCDYVTVWHDKLGIKADLQVIKTEYNVLAERYNSIVLGDEDDSLDKTITSIETRSIRYTKTETARTENKLSNALARQKQMMNGDFGGYVVTINDADGHPKEIIIGDAPTINDMSNCIRLNRKGIAFSQNGYSGDFTTAWTIDGAFNANFITAGKINGDRIEANTIRSSELVVGDGDKKAFIKLDGATAPTFVPDTYYERVSSRLCKHTITLSTYHGEEKTGEIEVLVYNDSETPIDASTIPNLQTYVNHSDQIDWGGNADPTSFATVFKKSSSVTCNAFDQYESAYDVETIELSQLAGPIYEEIQSSLESYYKFENDSVDVVKRGAYQELAEEPDDWSSNYNRYYYADEEQALGDYIKIGTDRTTGRPFIKISAGDSDIHLIETNDKVAFVRDGVEIAYISSTNFAAPSFRMGGYDLRQDDGVIFKWVSD